MRDLVCAATGSSRVWIYALKGRRLGEGATCDIVRAAIGSWSPLELTATCRYLGITGVCCLKAHFQCLPWQVQGKHFQVCLQTTDTSNSQVAASGSQLQG